MTTICIRTLYRNISEMPVCEELVNILVFLKLKFNQSLWQKKTRRQFPAVHLRNKQTVNSQTDLSVRWQALLLRPEQRFPCHTLGLQAT